MNEGYIRRSSLLIITHKFALAGEAVIFIEEDFALARASSANPQLMFLSAFFLSEFLGQPPFIFFGQPRTTSGSSFFSLTGYVLLFLARDTALFLLRAAQPVRAEAHWAPSGSPRADP